jgi:predicted nucleic acid-binding protein
LALEDDIVDDSEITFDTNSIIYFVEEHPAYFPLVQPLFVMVNAGRAVANVSAVSLAEVLVRPLRQDRPDLAERYRSVLTQSPHTRLYSVDAGLAEMAATIRARYGLGLPDAIVAATALQSASSHLVTNDPSFKRIEGVQVIVLEDHASGRG